MAVALDEWVRCLDNEYLAEFIAEGGSAVRLIVAPDIEAVDTALATLAGAAIEWGYALAWVDAGQTKVQLIEQLFHAVARQIDWETGTRQWLRNQLMQNGYTLPETGELDADSVVACNTLTRAELLAEARRWVAHEITSDHSLYREFRNAMAMLVLGQLNPQSVTPSDAEVVYQWLRGEKCSLSVLKRLRLFQRIGRHNGRFMLSSLATFLPRLGLKGLVVLLDIRPVVSDAPAGTGALRYTRAAVQDFYEVLRQCIDGTDEFHHFLLVAAAGPGLVENERRGLDSYTALKLRTIEDVRDKNRTNPLGMLVHLEGVPT
jgi:P-loop Domain of unknown function (DUF2791)